jgi:hypothetical protein
MLTKCLKERQNQFVDGIYEEFWTFNYKNVSQWKK